MKFWVKIMALVMSFQLLVGQAHAQFSDTWEFLDAVEDGDYKEIRTRLGRGANINALNTDGFPAIIIASDRKNLEMVKFLLEQGAKPDTRSEEGQDTALMRRADAGDGEAVKMLLDKGANVNLQDRLGETALIKAVRSRKTRIVSMLLEHGAEINIADYTGNNAMDHAKRTRGGRRLVQLLEKHGS